MVRRAARDSCSGLAARTRRRRSTGSAPAPARTGLRAQSQPASGSATGFVGGSILAPGSKAARPGTSRCPKNREHTAEPDHPAARRKELDATVGARFNDFDRPEAALTDRCSSSPAQHEDADRSSGSRSHRALRSAGTGAQGATQGDAQGRPGAHVRADGARRMEGQDRRAQAVPEQAAGRASRHPLEVGTREVLGARRSYTYQLGAFFGKDERDQPSAPTATPTSCTTTTASTRSGSTPATSTI